MPVKKSFLVSIAAITLMQFTMPSVIAADMNNLFDMDLNELLTVEITVASIRPATVFNSVSVVSTIDRQSIERYGYKSIEDALVTVSGFDVQRSYLKQSIPTSRGVLQDHYANKILFMIDGIPNWQAFGGDPIIGRIDINDVERIEVLKGPASVLYGTNAYVGAINIVTKTEPGNRISAGASNNDMRTLSASSRGEFEEVYYSISMNHRNKDEFSLSFRGEDGVTGKIDEYQKNTNLHAKLSYKQHDLTFNIYSGEESYYGSNITFSGGAGTDHTVDGYFINYAYQFDSENWGKTEFNALVDDQENEFDVNTLPTRLFWEGIKTTLSVKNLYDFNKKWTLESGMDYESRDSKDSRFMDPNGLVDVNGINKKVSEKSLFTQIYYISDKHNWVIGGRNVNNSLFGNNFSGRLSYVYNISDASSFKIIAGQSYRSPSLFELYGVIGCCILGNEQLKPEKSDTLEVSYLAAWDNWFLQATAYRASYKSKIFRGIEFNYELPNGDILDNVNRYRNGGDFDASGVEVELKYTSLRWNAFFNLTYVSGNDNDRLQDEDHYNFKYVPDLSFSTGFSARHNNWTLGVNGTYRGDSKSITDGVNSSFIADLALSYRRAQTTESGLTHQISIRNLSDEKVNVPEYARRRVVDELPLRYERTIAYEVSWNW